MIIDLLNTLSASFTLGFLGAFTYRMIKTI